MCIDSGLSVLSRARFDVRAASLHFPYHFSMWLLFFLVAVVLASFSNRAGKVAVLLQPRSQFQLAVEEALFIRKVKCENSHICNLSVPELISSPHYEKRIRKFKSFALAI